jgi:hypothetical protein
MDDDQRDIQATDSSPRRSPGDAPEADATAAAVARMLANPRRVRRA